MAQKNCLVVGSGKTALHQIKSLLEAQAHITVVGAEADAEIQRLAENKTIRYVPRKFTDSDLDGVYLAIVATNDSSVNQHVVARCHAQKILCCLADHTGISGDFVTPAIYRKDTLTVSVSSGGLYFRRYRLIRDNLGRHVEMMENADLLVIGTSHHQLSIQRREPFHLLGKRMEQTGQMMLQVWGIHEFMLLNTCNRVELVGIVSQETKIEDLLKRLMAFFHLKEEEYYVRRGFEAFEHVATVCAGLLSQSPGENHIVAQVKEALDYATQRGWAGSMMQGWIGSALHMSKDIRHATAPLLQSREIEDLCVDYLQAVCAGLAQKRIMVLGTGMVGEGLISRLLAAGHACGWCYHVNRPELKESWKKHITLSTFNDLPAHLPKIDVIICTAASPGYILHKGHAPFLAQDREILIMDLALPRNVEPALDNLTPDLKVVDLDGLKRWYHREILDMTRIFELSKQLVVEHRNLYEKITQNFREEYQSSSS